MRYLNTRAMFMTQCPGSMLAGVDSATGHMQHQYLQLFFSLLPSLLKRFTVLVGVIDLPLLGINLLVEAVLCVHASF